MNRRTDLAVTRCAGMGRTVRRHPLTTRSSVLAAVLGVGCLAVAACGSVTGRRANGNGDGAIGISAAAHTTVAGTVPVTGLSAVTSPLGDYTVGLPRGWSAHSVGRDSINMTQNGGSDTITILAGIPVSDLNAEAVETQCTQAFIDNPLTAPGSDSCVQQEFQTLEEDSAAAWSPQQAMQVILQSLGLSASLPDLEVHPVTQDAATFTVPYQESGQAMTAQGFVAVVPVQNPVLPGDEVTTEALLGYCTAPAGQAQSLRPLCAQVLGSFKTIGSAFWTNIVTGLANGDQNIEQGVTALGEQDVAGQAVTNQLISQWGQSMQQLQDQTYQSIQTQNLRSGQNAIAALGSNSIEQDPGTSERYSVPYGYSSYCLDGAGANVIYGNNLALGADGCATMLDPVN
jgi:hypothetical protein